MWIFDLSKFLGYNRRVSRNRYESFPFDSLLTSTFCVVSCIIMLMCTLKYHSTLSQSIFRLFIYYLFRHSIVRDHLRSKSSEEISILADTLPFNCFCFCLFVYVFVCFWQMDGRILFHNAIVLVSVLFLFGKLRPCNPGKWELFALVWYHFHVAIVDCCWCVCLSVCSFVSSIFLVRALSFSRSLQKFRTIKHKKCMYRSTTT